MSSRSCHALLAGAIIATACAPDAAVPGYDDPFLNNTGGASGAGGASGGGGVTSPTTTGTSTPPSVTGGMTIPASASCDLSGRWIATQRTVEEALGVQQALRQWMYFELAQSGDQITATRGLDCGFDVVPLSTVAGAADLHRAWPAIAQNNPMAGRRGTIKTVSGGCSVSFDAYVSVYGATVSFYKDPSRALPGPNDKASATTPGWEDWDADGNPGITYNLSGIASGQVFYASRMTNTWSGTVGATSPSFTLANGAKHDADQLGINGSSLLTTQPQLAANQSLHFVELARLDSTQATGDDTTTCNAVRTLATTLTPKGNLKPVQ